MRWEFLKSAMKKKGKMNIVTVEIKKCVSSQAEQYN
jgi:hypothetical protein